MYRCTGNYILRLLWLTNPWQYHLPTVLVKQKPTQLSCFLEPALKRKQVESLAKYWWTTRKLCTTNLKFASWNPITKCKCSFQTCDQCNKNSCVTGLYNWPSYKTLDKSVVWLVSVPLSSYFTTLHTTCTTSLIILYCNNLICWVTTPHEAIMLCNIKQYLTLLCLSLMVTVDSL